MENIPVANKDATFKDLAADPKAFVGTLRKRTTWSHLLSRLPHKLRTQWPTRTIVLLNGCLYVFKREGDEKSCSAYSLYGYYKIQLLEDLSETVEQPHGFIVRFAQHSVGMNLYFASTSDEDRKKWIEKLSQEMTLANHFMVPGDIRPNDLPVDSDLGDIDDLYDLIKTEEMNQATNVVRGSVKTKKPLPPIPTGIHDQNDSGPPSSPNYLSELKIRTGGDLFPSSSPVRTKRPPVAPKPKVLRSKATIESVEEEDEHDYESCDEFRCDYDDIKAMVQNDLFLRAFTTRDIELSSFRSNGLFYIRESSKGKRNLVPSSTVRFTLCVFIDDLTRKFIVTQEGDNNYLEADKTKQFKEMNDLLIYYRENPIPSTCVSVVKLSVPFRELCENTGS